MKKTYVILLTVFLFGQCIGIKNKSKVSGQGILALLTGGTVGSNPATHNGNPASGTGNGTSDYASSDIKAAVGGTLGLGTELSLTVPADALEADRTLTVKRTAVASSDPSLVPIQSAYQFGPEDLNFSEPATLKVCYNPELLKNKKLTENAIQIYYLDPDTKELASVGGTVDPVSHCVTAQVEHFSTYIPAVTTAAVLTVSSSTVTPARPIIGMPLKVKTKITPTSASPLASAFISYRIKGSGAAFTKVPLTQDSKDTTALSFYTVFPASTVTSAGLEYFIEATDEAGTYKRLPSKGVSTRLITRTLNTAVPLRFNVLKPAITVTSGSYRNIALQVQDGTGLWQTVFSEANDLSGNAGTLSYIGNTIRFTAGQVGAGTLTSSFGGYSASLGITVKVGALAKIELLDSAGAIITAPVNIIKGKTFGFKAMGYDSFGNSRTVNPTFTAANGIGTYTKLTGVFQAAAAPNISGTLTATVGKFTDSVNINIIPDSFPISGTVTGIPAGKTAVIQNNGTDDLTLSGDGGFTFASNVFSGSGYNVTLSAVPPGVECMLANNAGTVNLMPILNVNVECKIKAGIVLANDWSQVPGAERIANNGIFSFNNETYMLGLHSNRTGLRLQKNVNGIWIELTALSIDFNGYLRSYYIKENDGIYFLMMNSTLTGSLWRNYIRIIKYDGTGFSETTVSDGTVDRYTNALVSGKFCVPETPGDYMYPLQRYFIKSSNSFFYMFLSCDPQSEDNSVYSFDGNNLVQILSPFEISQSLQFNNSGKAMNGLFEYNNIVYSIQTKSNDWYSYEFKFFKLINSVWLEVEFPFSKQAGFSPDDLSYYINNGKFYLAQSGSFLNGIYSFDGNGWTVIYDYEEFSMLGKRQINSLSFLICKGNPTFIDRNSGEVFYWHSRTKSWIDLSAGYGVGYTNGFSDGLNLKVMTYNPYQAISSFMQYQCEE